MLGYVIVDNLPYAYRNGELYPCEVGSDYIKTDFTKAVPLENKRFRCLYTANEISELLANEVPVTSIKSKKRATRKKAQESDI